MAGLATPSAKNHQEQTEESFIRWFRDALLPRLPAGTPCLIVLDSAPHHTTRRQSTAAGTPSADTMSREALLIALDQKKVPVPPNALTAELRALYKTASSASSSSSSATATVVELAEQRGHRVLFVPPRHNYLLPTEQLWARVKIAMSDDKALASSSSSSSSSAGGLLVSANSIALIASASTYLGASEQLRKVVTSVADNELVYRMIMFTYREGLRLVREAADPSETLLAGEDEDYVPVYCDGDGVDEVDVMRSDGESGDEEVEV